MPNKFLTYIFALLAVLLAGCSDVLDWHPAGIDQSGEVTFTFDVPAPARHLSRADEPDPEFKVNALEVFIYSAEGDASAALQHESLSYGSSGLRWVSGNKYQVQFTLNKNLRTVTGLRLFFVANCPVTLSPTATISDLRAATTSSPGISGDLAMSGSATLASVLSGNPAVLIRNGAKVSATTFEGAALPFDVFGSAAEGSVLAGLDGSTFTPSVAAFEADVPADASQYVLSTTNSQASDGIGGSCFVIVKAPYSGTDYFYRLDFTSKDPDDPDAPLTYFSLLPNHWYEFSINSIEAAGFASPAEAARHPANGVTYVIHDHAPVSFNMASDGFRELGVSHTILYKGSSQPDSEWSDEYVYIKFFSKDASEQPASAQQVDATYSIEDTGWLALSTPERVTDSDLVGSDFGSDTNDTGVVYRMKVRFKTTSRLGSLNNNIKVNWMGLERSIPIIWERDFDGSTVTSAVLDINYNGTMPGFSNSGPRIADYWGFLESTDDPEHLAFAVDNLWGIQTEANNGKVRNAGFHFPVMFGSGSNFAEYTYTLTFDRGKFAGLTGYTWDVSVTGDVAGVTHTESSGCPLTVTIKRPGSLGPNDYDYTTGKINITITYADGTSEPFNFDLYHTGFFFEDPQTYRMGPKDPNNFYYYEVMPVTVGSKTRYMLDRNLGATSAQMYVRDSDGSTALGNPDAAGGYYSVARQMGTNAYEPPLMYDETSNRVSPPGYQVPSKETWDALRVSTSFHNEAVSRYFPVYYDSPNPKCGRIYFPKSMMMLSGVITGESRTGYYWTSTPSTGTEKEEIGKWLNMFVLTGSSTSFTNGCVDDTNSQPYGASVRCMNIFSDVAEVVRTSFYVTGATHVYLYTEDENHQRTATTNWPGHPIGNFATMTDGRWFNFSFQSSQFRPEDLKVIFNYVDKDGKIFTYSHTPDGSTRLSYDVSPELCYGWDVIGDTNPAIIPADSYTTIDGQVLEPASATALKNWWRCGGRTSGTPYVYDYKLGERPAPPSILYLVGDATSAGWDIDNPIEITAESDGVYVWTGQLNVGSFKAALSKGSWDVNFYMPRTLPTYIYHSGLNNSPMVYASNNQDAVWEVKEAGKYKVTFDTNNNTISVIYLDRPIYLVGNATTAGWDINNPIEIQASSDGIYVWEGDLFEGEFKAASAKGQGWSIDFYMPSTMPTYISSSGITNNGMNFELNNDVYKWTVTEPGKYSLTFDTNQMKLFVEFIAATRTIKMLNTAHWDQVYIYYWHTVNGSDDNYNHAWPGQLMENRDGDYWYFDIPLSATKIIFTAGNAGPQTGNIDVKTDNPNYVYSN